MKTEYRNDHVEYLYDAIMAIRNKDECRAFFETLCTQQELRSFAQRICVAKLLYDGSVYSRIVEQTGASTATISRVNRSMNMGKNGYEAVFARMREQLQCLCTVL